MTGDATPFWGPMFPDWAGAGITIPAVAAFVALGPPLLNGGAGDLLRAVHSVPGVFGNGWRVRFVEGTLASAGEVQVSGGDVTILFNDGDQIGDIIATVNAAGPLLLQGPFNPTDQLFGGDDEFDYIDLEHGVDATTHLAGFFGPAFPDGPEDELPPLITPVGPETVATFVLQLSSMRLTLGYASDVIKSYSALERRVNVLDDPRQAYQGEAKLFGSEMGEIRDALARHAALGSPFSLALPHEQTTTTSDVNGGAVPLSTATASLDWANVGQRVAIGSTEHVIQDVDTSSIEVLPAVAAPEGTLVMPLVPVLLDPAQAFQRRRTAAETWPISARAAISGFPTLAQSAEAEITGTVEFAGVTIRTRTAGITLDISLVADSPVGITVDVSSVGATTTLVVHFADGGSTIEQLLAAIGAYIMLIGSYDPASILTVADEFDVVLIGTPAADPVYGRGATVRLAADTRPVWDRGVRNTGTVGDSMQSMAAIVELGVSVPTSVGMADEPDWGRQLAATGAIASSEWQWLKKWLATVAGRFASFWVPTYREDLEPDGNAAATTLTIVPSDSFDLWYSDRGYRMLAVKQASGTKYVRITAETAGVLTVDGDTLDAAAVLRISWMELCRLEGDDVEVSFSGGTRFDCAMNARAVQQ